MARNDNLSLEEMKFTVLAVKRKARQTQELTGSLLALIQVNGSREKKPLLVVICLQAMH